MITPFYESADETFSLFYGDSVKILSGLNYEYNMVFADPPYFLSNDGLTIRNGKVTSVNKAEWDKSEGKEIVDNFNFNWISAVRKKMKPNGTIWISSTSHNVFSIGQILQLLDFKILNVVTWHKTNPPPNFSKKFFTHSTEFIIWARKEKKITHYYDYELMKSANGGKQMQDYWKLSAIGMWEKKFGKHPTQKPLPLLARIVLASTKESDLILDPFTGSSTTGIAANLYNRRFVGIDNNIEYLELSKLRKEELKLPGVKENLLTRI